MDTFALLLAVAVIGAFIYFPRSLMVITVIIVLAVSCSRGANAADLRFEVAAVIESEADRPAMQEAAAYAARIYKDQLGVELVVTAVSVDTIASDTHAPTLLGKVQTYRVDHLTADATVLFTRRELRGYAGIATEGPACSAGAAAVVVVRQDGYDGQILAHELLHTVGVPHDKAGGYLMSESPSRAGSDYMSPDSVLTFKAAPIGQCMTVTSAQPAAAPAQAAQGSTGGGGAMEWVWLILLAGIAVVAEWNRRRAMTYRQRAQDLEDTLKLLTPPGITDVMYVEQRNDSKGGKWLVIQFATLNGMASFHGWVTEEHRRAIVRIREQIAKAVK